MDNTPLGFLKQKLQQGLSDVENWGSSAGNDITHAIGSLFGNNSTPQNSAPAQPVRNPINSGPNLAVAQQNVNPVQNQQPQQLQQPQQQNLPKPIQIQGTRPDNVPLPNLAKPNANATPINNGGTPVAPPKVAPVKIANAKTNDVLPAIAGYVGKTAGDAIKAAPGFVNNTIVQPVVKTVTGDITYPTAELIADVKGDKAAAAILDQEAQNAQAGSLPQTFVRTTGQLLNAARYVPGAVGNEIINATHPTPASADNISAQQGLRALNQSTVGLSNTGAEDIMAHNIPGARDLAVKSGFDPNQSIAATVAKSGVGLLQDANPLWGFEHGDPLGAMSGLNLIKKGGDIIQAVRSGAVDPNAAAAALLNSDAVPNISEEGVNRVFQSNPMLPSENATHAGISDTDTIPPQEAQTLSTPETPEQIPPEQKARNTPVSDSYPNNTTNTPEVNTPRSLEEAQDRSEEANKVPSPYDLRKGYGVSEDQITDADRREAQLTSSTPEYIAGRRIFNKRTLAAESAAQDVLRSGGTRDEAIDAYQKEHPGLTRKDAAFRVSKMAKESDMALHPNKRSDNPEEGQHNLPRAREGDYDQATINRGRVGAVVDHLNKFVQKALGALSDKDRGDFVDYAEGTKDISEADNPDAVQTAIEAGRKLTDTVNAFDHSLGGQTPHIENYVPGYVDRPQFEPSEEDYNQAANSLEEEMGPDEWSKLSGQEQDSLVKQRIGEMVKRSGVDENFGGYRNQNRRFATRAERQEAGVKDLFSDPRDLYNHYAKQAKGKLGNDAFAKAAQEADVLNRTKGPKTIDVRYGNGDKDTVRLSDKGGRAYKDQNLNYKGSQTTLVKNISKASTAIKNTVASIGVPHAILIPPRAIAAWVGLKIHTFANDFLKGKNEAPVHGDNVEFGHRIGSPLQTDFHSRNPIAQFTFGHLLPAIHDRILSAAKDYMDSKGIDPDSAQGRSLGTQINDVMGYSKGHDTAGWLVFAPSLLKSTIDMYGKSVIPGNFVDRWGSLGPQVANQVVGVISKNVSNQILQNQGDNKDKIKDDFWSTVVKEALSPSVYTPYHNSKTGEQISLGIPGQYQSDIARIPVGMTRDSSGQLKPTINSPSQMVTNAGQAARNILAPLPSAALSIATNATYNGTQIRDPNASIPRQAAQTGVNLGVNSLPIPASGALSSIHAPGWLQNDIPSSSTEQSVPLPVRAAGQFLGMNPRSDVTTGQGPAIQEYYAGQQEGKGYIAANSDSTSTEAHNMSAYNLYFTKAKNDAGQTVQLTPGEKQTVYTALYNNPTALRATQIANQKTANHDPIWDLPSNDQGGTYIGNDGKQYRTNSLQLYAMYQKDDPGSAERTQLEQLNPWLSKLFTAQSQWATSTLQNSTSVKSSQPLPGGVTWSQLQYPNISDDTQSKLGAITQLSSVDPAQRTTDQIQQLNTLENDPGVKQAYKDLAAHTNAERVADGLPPLKTSPDEPPAVTAAFTAYNSLSKNTGARSTWIKQHPDLWNQMNNYMTAQSMYTVDKQGALNELQGEHPSNSLLAGIYDLGQYDITKTGNPNGTNTYALDPQGAYAQRKAAKGSSSSKTKPFVQLPSKPKKHATKISRLKVHKVKAIRISKSNPIRIKKKSVIQPVHIGHPGPLKIK